MEQQQAEVIGGSAEAISSELVPFDFRGDRLELVRHDGAVMVGLRRFCEALGVDFSSQLKKLTADEAVCVVEITTHDSSGRRQGMSCIELDAVPYLLATIKTGKVKPELREKLVTYKREVVKVLRDAFLGQRQQAQQVSRDELEDRRQMRALCAASINMTVQVAQLVAKVSERFGTVAVMATVPAPTKTERRPRVKTERKPRSDKGTRRDRKAEPAPDLFAERFVSGAYLASRLDITPHDWNRYLRNHPEIRKHQRHDCKWPLLKTSEAYRAERAEVQRKIEARRAASEAERAQETRNADLRLRSDINEMIRTHGQASRLDSEGYGNLWRELYREFSRCHGYDPQAERIGKDQLLLDVIEERGDLWKLHRIAQSMYRPQ